MNCLMFSFKNVHKTLRKWENINQRNIQRVHGAEVFAKNEITWIP